MEDDDIHRFWVSGFMILGKRKVIVSGLADVRLMPRRVWEWSMDGR